MNEYIHIIEGDTSSTPIARITTCCGGTHQTIAGALLKSKEWKAWREEVSRRMSTEDYQDVYDTDETTELGEMSDDHFNAFVKWLQDKSRERGYKNGIRAAAAWCKCTHKLKTTTAKKVFNP